MTRLENILPASKELFANGFFLLILKPERIPPHLALIADNHLYELHIKGKNIALPVCYETFFAAHHSYLAIQLNTLPDKKRLQQVFARYSCVNRRISCLAPIKDYFSVDIPAVKKVNFVFELIPVLQQHNIISNVYHHQVKLQNQAFTLTEYSQEEIIKQIEKLKQHYRVTI